MRVTVSVAGAETRDVEFGGETYADLLESVGMSRHEATVLVDGTPVPEDQVVESSSATVLPLVRGG
ncbi:MAG: ubiquitin-like small modifier protein 2 [Halanaeroarchaeum sp.]